MRWDEDGDRPPWLTPGLMLPFAVVLVFAAYRYLQPRPIPGIPYNKRIGLLGDIPELLALVRKGTSARPWFWQMAQRHQSPVTQIFLRPFELKPTVLLVDYRETYDILFRRNREFDRSHRSAQIFAPVIPDHHIAMRSSDPRFKKNKELVKNLMTPSFLNKVSAPAIHAKLIDLVDLWDFKTRTSEGHPFAAFQDINEVSMDFIWAVAFGLDPQKNLCKSKLEDLKRSQVVEIPSEPDRPVTFRNPPLPPDFQALYTVNKSLEIGNSSPIPRLHHWLLRSTIWRKEFALKERLITNAINKAVDRIKRAADLDDASRCAMDFMITREMLAAKKQEVKPDFHRPSMRDELLGYLIAGHETSGTTLGWIIKYLSDNQIIQEKLRRQLRISYAEALKEERHPNAAEITQNAAPYMDAFLEECLRHTVTIPILMRQATVDTTILGHFIPKDTNVMLFTLGASITEPSVPVDNADRSETSTASKERVADWDDATIHLFSPERWLRPKEGNPDGHDELDNVEFNPQAGPFITFGGGPRGCFGKRLAYLELRIAIALLVWNFEFQKCAPDLSSYDGIDVFTTVPKYCYVKLRKVATH